jgi:hypothetical protein
MEILLRGAACMLLVALALAWLATFSKLLPIAAVQRLVKDYGALIRSHIDFMLMALFCMAFYTLRVPVPTLACWLVVIGGFSNPSLFLLRSVIPSASGWQGIRLLRAASFTITTIGFGWVGLAMLAMQPWK